MGKKGKTGNKEIIEDDGLEYIGDNIDSYKPCLSRWSFETLIRTVLNTFKDKYNILIDAEINVPKVLFGKATVYYVVFIRVDGGVVPLLRTMEEITLNLTEENIYYLCYVNTLKLLFSDVHIQEVLNNAKSKSAEQVSEGSNSPDLRIVKDGPESEDNVEGKTKTDK